VSTPIPEDKLAQIKEELFHGRKIQAIKLYREMTGLGLAEAKDAVERMELQIRGSTPVELPQLTPRVGTPISDQMLAQINEELCQGRKIMAIKLYREATGFGLAKAKTDVERMEAQLRTASPEKFAAIATGKGCFAVVAVVCLALGLVACRVFA